MIKIQSKGEKIVRKVVGFNYRNSLLDRDYYKNLYLFNL